MLIEPQVLKVYSKIKQRTSKSIKIQLNITNGYIKVENDDLEDKSNTKLTDISKIIAKK